MDHGRFLPLIAWIAEAGLSGQREVDLLQGFCERAGAAGLPLRRAVLGVDTLHPVLEGRIFQWHADAGSPTEAEYGRSDPGASDANWRQSPFFQLYESGVTMLRRRLPAPAGEFPVLDELGQQGMTDYIAIVHRFGARARSARWTASISSWSTDATRRLRDADIEALRRLVAERWRSRSRAPRSPGSPSTLVEVYLGRDAGQRVLDGRIQRGVADRIERGAVVLRPARLHHHHRHRPARARSSRCSTTMPRRSITAIHEAGGDVLKLIGDGTLAIFRADDRGGRLPPRAQGRGRRASAASPN